MYIERKTQEIEIKDLENWLMFLNDLLFDYDGLKWEEGLRKDHSIIELLEDSGENIGFFSTFDWTDESSGIILECSNIVINPSFRGKGYTKKIYKTALSFMNKESVYAIVDESNIASRIAHERITQNKKERNGKFIYKIRLKEL